MNDLPLAVVALDEHALDAIAQRVAAMLRLGEQSPGGTSLPDSPYLTVREAAQFLRCSRQRVDDLLSHRRLSRVKDGRRTLVLRAELDEYLVHHARRMD